MNNPTKKIIAREGLTFLGFAIIAALLIYATPSIYDFGSKYPETEKRPAAIESFDKFITTPMDKTLREK